ncbi:MAG: hypothetical protein M5U26_21835 [Planctomycetota bacterium]|nr:hypothetical protein [Planctomycetota bacterium]
MKCPHCQGEVTINHEFCPHCGQRITLAFDQIAQSVHVDAAYRRGRQVEQALRYMIVALIFSAAVITGFNHLWDRELEFGGADLPAPEAPPADLGETASLVQPYRDTFKPPQAPPSPPQAFAHRFLPLRDQIRSRNGARPEVADAIDNALRFLVRSQEKDGFWDVDVPALRVDKARDESFHFKWGKVGVTALCVMAFLGEGHAWFPDPKGQVSKYGSNVQRAVRWLTSIQDSVNGRFGPPEGNFMYNHGLATIALSEAAGMSGDLNLRKAAQLGVNLIERTQGPSGGWGYKDQVSERQDTSVTSWQVQALLAAREAGLKVNPEVLAKALAYYQEATDAKTGVVMYDFTDRQVRPDLYGVALMIRLYLEEPPSTPEIRLLARKSVEYLPVVKKDWGRSWREGKVAGVDDNDRALNFDPYRWYFASHGLFFYGGEPWSTYQQSLQRAVLGLQDADGAWRANDIWSVKAGINYSTALCVLTLQAFHRIQ